MVTIIFQSKGEREDMMRTKVTPILDHRFIVRGVDITSIIDIKQRQLWDYEENKLDNSRVKLLRNGVILNLSRADMDKYFKIARQWDDMG